MAYQTQQRKRLLAYLAAHADKPQSVRDIVAGLSAAHADKPQSVRDIVAGLSAMHADKPQPVRETVAGLSAAHADKPQPVRDTAAGLSATHADKPQPVRDTAAAPGTSTVYRQMEKLVDEGLVKRFVRGHSRQFLYQLTGGEPCRHHLHLKCIKCGQLAHLDAELSARIENEVRTESSFLLDRGETVLYGCCKHCRESENGKK